ncbi:hypothetical protein [Comamonas suwonensis]|uniref:hypothetical protein n=1 Tax=Comamonas suwonensis TaxID=2606214 RepID=UPI00145F0F78|nr:hypothetical protein [Comamonas suwonensis]MBI1623913.1 hypothetical protein [Comamonas suwonensis]
MQYTVAAHAGGYVVARSRGNGEWIAVQESACYESCRREAIRLNAEQKARQRLEQARLISASLQPRRSLRYFEPDAFA